MFNSSPDKTFLDNRLANMEKMLVSIQQTLDAHMRILDPQDQTALPTRVSQLEHRVDMLEHDESKDKAAADVSWERRAVVGTLIITVLAQLVGTWYTVSMESRSRHDVRRTSTQITTPSKR